MWTDTRAVMLGGMIMLGTLALAASDNKAEAACGLGQTPAVVGTTTFCGSMAPVSTDAGDVEVGAWKGIRYAIPPTPQNGLRWKPPAPYTQPVGQVDATQFGSSCPQSAFVNGASTLVGSEDCLFLNVYAPAEPSQTKRPVMVFIHGGAYVVGAGGPVYPGAPNLYDGSYMAASGDVVVVTMNYRLAALGFLGAADTKKQISVSGNLALMDQQLAMKWVFDNIASFGGDAGQVTLFGESAGAMSVGLHLFSVPSSFPYFKAAIMESNPMGVEYRSPSEAAANGSQFLNVLCKAAGNPKDCPANAAWLNDPSLSTEIVMQAQADYSSLTRTVTRILKSGLTEGLPWTPVVDGSFVVGQPVDGYGPGMGTKPFIFGTNMNEGATFAGLASTKGRIDFVKYGAAMAAIYGTSALKIEAYKTASGDQPYNARKVTPPYYFTGGELAFSNVGTDDIFRCANIRAGTLAGNASGAQPIHGYLFTQKPVFNLYPNPTPLAACQPEAGNVCHANELPYVFNTIDQFMPGGVPEAQSALAKAMVKAWTDYAKTEDPGWPAWVGTAPTPVYQVWGDQPAPSPSVAVAANCPGLWDGITAR